MATNRVPIQLLRSEVLNKRPDPVKLLPGQPAVNTNADQPGLFFADSSGTGQLFKVGPCAVGASAPNAGATGTAGQLGNTLGEMWLDTSGDPALKVWDGSQWISVGGGGGSANGLAIISATAPDLTSYLDGQLWWDSSTGIMYVLYNDGVTRQWTQVSANTVQ